MTSILLVDDDPGVLEATSAILDAYGFSVIVADTGIKAKELIKSQDIDIAVIDLFMPGESGISVIRDIKQKFPVIAVSGENVTITDLSTYAKDAGANRFVRKPFSGDTLKRTIHSLLG